MKTKRTPLQQDAYAWMSELMDWLWDNAKQIRHTTEHFTGNIKDTFDMNDPEDAHLQNWTYTIDAKWDNEHGGNAYDGYSLELRGKATITTHNGEQFHYTLTTLGAEEY